MSDILEALSRHPWITAMLKSKEFHETCKHHITQKRRFFCRDCMDPPFCDTCRKKTHKHEGHNLIETLRSSYQSAVRVEIIKEFFDIGDIHVYSINFSKILYINKRKGNRQPCRRINAARKCQDCEMELVAGSNSKFCSIECKITYYEKSSDSSQGDTTSLWLKPRGGRSVTGKRERKGTPFRSPFW